MRLLISLLLVPVFMVSLACQQSPTDIASDSPLSAAGTWTDKVTGGGLMDAGSLCINVTVSATDQDGVRGQVEYTVFDGCDPDTSPILLQWHGVVDDLQVDANFPGIINICGNITQLQDNSGFPDWAEGDPFGIAIMDVEGGDDRLRQNADAIDCDTFYTGPSFPATMIDGEFNIRSK